MELGLTFPLQRFLKMKPPLYGTEPDRRFCWDVHNIRIRGREVCWPFIAIAGMPLCSGM